MSSPSVDGGFSSAVISVRIVDIDYYLMPLDKYSASVPFQAARLTIPASHTIPKLPTIRIFGCTPAGQKACVHLHGLRPYLYVPLPSSVPLSKATSFCGDLRVSLESALVASFSSSDTHNVVVGNSVLANSAPSFIADIEPVYRTSIYGYHANPSVFLKISTFSPRTVPRLASMLWSGGGLPDSFSCEPLQPYESHIPFVLQVLTDLSLVGMGYINLSSCKFRLPLPSHSSLPREKLSDPWGSSTLTRIFTDEIMDLRPDLFWSFTAYRQTVCDIELDAFASDVLNPLDPSQRQIFGQRSGPDGYAVRTLQTLWEEERLRTGRKPRVPEDEPRSVVAGPFLSEVSLMRKLKELLSNESRNVDEDQPPEGIFAETACHLPNCGDFQESSQDTNDVIAILDSSDTNPHFSPTYLRYHQQDVGCSSSSEESDIQELIHSDERGDDWGAINESTQACLENIPQGDGAGDIGSTDDSTGKQKISGVKRYADTALARNRRLKRVGEYKLLQVTDQNDVPKKIVPNPENARDPQPKLVECEENETRIFPAIGNDVRAIETKITDEKINAVGCPGLVLSISDGKKCHEPLDIDKNASRTRDDVHVDEGLDTRAINEASSSIEACRLKSPLATSVREELIHNFRDPHPIVNEQSFDVLVPARSPPSCQDVLDSFALEGLPRICHQEPIYGMAGDYNDRHRNYGCVGRRIGISGVKGLMHHSAVFGDSDPVTIAPYYDVVIPVDTPPSLHAVRNDIMRRQNSDLTKHVDAGTRAAMVIDSAGRQVGIDAKMTADAEFRTQFSVFSPSNMRQARNRVRRRMENCFAVQDDSCSDDSIVEDRTLSLDNGLSSSSAQSRREREPFDRPLSPKYDEQFTSIETPSKSRKPCHEYRDLESPVLLVKKALAGSVGSKIPRSNASPMPNRTSRSKKNLSLLIVEIIASSHTDRLSDPRIDCVLGVCVLMRDDRMILDKVMERCVLLVQGVTHAESLAQEKDVSIVCSEEELLDATGSVIREFNPDFICGFETQMSSIGFLLERAEHLKHKFSKLISRVLEKTDNWNFGAENGPPNSCTASNPGAEYFRRKGADTKVLGRHILNLWRIVRKEVKLNSYSAAGVAQEVLNVALPVHRASQLEEWIKSESRVQRALQYLKDQVFVDLAIVDKLDILNRTSELATVYGIDFMSVITRGSQYRVESMLARVAHARGFVLLSAQRDQVYNQPAVECLPLVMEPASNFYVDPVIVLDFQSLYPSMIIAHNLCFSTMLGNINRLTQWTDVQQVGVVRDYTAPSPLDIERPISESATEGIYVAPNGEMFVTAMVRRGLLPQMLQEILETRVMVKTAMKQRTSGDDDLMKTFNSRQFALKLIANVTYGYAAASFSGRMPCAGLADSIVQCGRAALERIVNYVDSELHAMTGASVVYGDTDSLFVKVPGASRADAFAVGSKICAMAASMFPVPIKLQLEKVYHPCVLVTKKRYVGYAFEAEDCSTPIFDAKGIETVRRDSCGIVQKTMEQALRVLFESKDVSRVKRLVQRTLHRIITNRQAVPDYIFRKEVRMGTYKDILPPAAVVASRMMERDPRAAPRHGERVAFVVVFSGAGAALKDCVVSPGEMLEMESRGTARLHSTYYISKQILPTLDRIFSLIGVNVFSWYSELPRACFDPIGVGSVSKIQLYFPKSRPCVLCRGPSVGSAVCNSCRTTYNDEQASYFLVAMRQQCLEQKLTRLNACCVACVGGFERDHLQVRCESLNCPIRFERHRSLLMAHQGQAMLQDLFL